MQCTKAVCGSNVVRVSMVQKEVSLLMQHGIVFNHKEVQSIGFHGVACGVCCSIQPRALLLPLLQLAAKASLERSASSVQPQQVQQLSICCV